MIKKQFPMGRDDLVSKTTDFSSKLVLMLQHCSFKADLFFRF